MVLDSAKGVLKVLFLHSMAAVAMQKGSGFEHAFRLDQCIHDRKSVALSIAGE